MEISGYELWLVERYAGPALGLRAWCKTWDLTEEEDYIYGYAS
jgi:hypothetical protein